MRYRLARERQRSGTFLTTLVLLCSLLFLSTLNTASSATAETLNDVLDSTWALENDGKFEEALERAEQAELILIDLQIETGKPVEAVRLTRARILLALNRPNEALNALQSMFFFNYGAMSQKFTASAYEKLGLFFQASASLEQAIEEMEALPDVFSPVRIARHQLGHAYLGARSDVWGVNFVKYTEQAIAAIEVLDREGAKGPAYFYPRILSIYDRPLEALDLYLDQVPAVHDDIKVLILIWTTEIQLEHDMFEAAKRSIERAILLAEKETYKKDYLTILKGKAELELGEITRAAFTDLVTKTMQLRQTDEPLSFGMVYLLNTFQMALEIARLEGVDGDLLDEALLFTNQITDDFFAYDRVGQDALRAVQIELAEQYEMVGDFEAAAEQFEKARLSWAIPNSQFARALAGLARTGDYDSFSRLGFAEQAVHLARDVIEKLPARLPTVERQSMAAFEQVFETHLDLAWQDMRVSNQLSSSMAYWDLTGQQIEPPLNMIFFEWKHLLPDERGEVFYQHGADRLEQVLESAQMARLTEAGRAAAATTSRLAEDTGELGRLIRQRDELIAHRELLAKQGSERREQLGDLDDQIDEIDAQLEDTFPGYTEFSRPKPMNLAEIHAALLQDEALVLMFEGQRQINIWFASKDHIVWYRPKTSPKDLASAIDKLRMQLDPTSAARSAEALEPDRGVSEVFDFETAHALFKSLLSPIDLIAPDTKHILVVPDGAAHSLPLALLVTRDVAGQGENPSPLNEMPWAIKRFAFTTVPIVSTLRASGKPQESLQTGDIPFVGIGDPILNGRLTPLQLAAADVRRNVNADDLRGLSPLPETADELAAINNIVADGAGELLLRDRAVEPLVRDGRLASAKVISFATHGLMAGELPGQTEPSLVLTPPDQSDALNDGLLSASEIAKLTLSADWVILSACNTAAGDGTGDSEGLSGLSRAFFYAGARALVVSHWSVQSDPTVDLISEMFRAAAENPEFRKAEALQSSILEMISNPRRSGFDHPAAWAPFVVVGR